MAKRQDYTKLKRIYPVVRMNTKKRPTTTVTPATLIAALYDPVGGSLATPIVVSGGSQWKQNVTHSAQGYTFPDSLAGLFGTGTTSDFQMLHQDTSTTDLPTLLTRMENSVVTGTLPNGTSGNFIRSEIKTANGVTPPQTPLRIQQATEANLIAVNELFVEFDLFLPANLATLFDSNYANNKYWLEIFAIKEGFISGSTTTGGYRFSVQIQIPSGGGTIYFKIRGDNSAGLNATDGDIIYWTKNATSITVPLGQWFKLMTYVKRPPVYTDEDSGISWAGIATYTNGTMDSVQTLHTQLGGVQKGRYNNEFNRLYCPTTYTKAVPFSVDWCNLKIWNKSPIDLPLT